MDSSDEEPGYCGHRVCPQGWFACANRRCIHTSVHCNGIDNCGDNSDEKGCISCPEDEGFRCTNGKCIIKAFRCDRDNDCGDASDEMGCPPRNCSLEHENENMINCPHTTACVHKEWYCDGDDDCFDGSDEKNCTEKCVGMVFQCAGNGKCINLSERCDGKDDCHDGNGDLSSDEQYCSEYSLKYVDIIL